MSSNRVKFDKFSICGRVKRMNKLAKTLTIGFISFSSCVTAAGVGQIIPSLSEYPADGVDVAKVEAAYEELGKIQVRIVEILESVKDRESADAAAEELFFIIGRVQELRDDYKKLEHCDAETRNRLTTKLLKESAAIAPRKKAAAKALLDHDFYGSEDLKDALRQMM